jgi:microcystin degradation protein MlrC
MRIAVLHFSHETVTFLKSDTTVDDFIYQGSPTRGEALLQSQPRSYIGGFVKVAREHDGVELVGIESPLFPKRGTASGWITTEAFERFLGKMIAELKAEGPFDGVYLSLHGAMGVRGVPRPEAEIARRVRAVVGRKAVVAGTFDPHGNEDAEFLAAADMAFCVKYFPHYDDYLQGERCARTMIRAIRGDYRPATVTLKVPIITPTVLQWTGASPWMDLVQRALTWEAREPDVYVNAFFGFPWCDVPDAGLTFQVMTNGDPDLARRVADDMAGFAWRKRADLVGSTKVHTMAEGVAAAKQAVADGRFPVVLADHSDRSGAATWLLEQVIAQGLRKTLIATLADEEACARLAGAKVGDAVDMAVGGRLDESASGAGSATSSTPPAGGTAPASAGSRSRSRTATWWC